MSQNGQAHFKNLAVNTARFLKCAWPFWDFMHKRDNFLSEPSFTKPDNFEDNSEGVVNY